MTEYVRSETLDVLEIDGESLVLLPDGQTAPSPLPRSGPRDSQPARRGPRAAGSGGPRREVCPAVPRSADRRRRPWRSPVRPWSGGLVEEAGVHDSGILGGVEEVHHGPQCLNAARTSGARPGRPPVGSHRGAQGIAAMRRPRPRPASARRTGPGSPSASARRSATWSRYIAPASAVGSAAGRRQRGAGSDVPAAFATPDPPRTDTAAGLGRVQRRGLLRARRRTRRRLLVLRCRRTGRPRGPDRR